MVSGTHPCRHNKPVFKMNNIVSINIPNESLAQNPSTDILQCFSFHISGDIELKVSPLPAFNPDRKPSKGVLKTPVRAMTPNRPKATDYF